MWTHSEGLRLALKDGNVDFHEGNQIFFWPILEKCSSIMSPICRFLVDQIWQFQEGHLTLRETIPVQICEREGCGNFTLAERVGRKRFCSNQCRALAYQGSREDWNEYMRNYRKLREQRKGKIKSRRRTKGKR